MDTVQLLATFAIGLYAGSLLTEALILVPYWKKMTAEDFFRLHGDVGPSLFRYFAPLTTAAVGLSIVAAIMQGDVWGFRTVTALLCLAALVIFYIYFRAANQSFADHSLDNAQLGTELSRWGAWHWLRTVIILLAFILSIAAYI